MPRTTLDEIVEVTVRNRAARFGTDILQANALVRVLAASERRRKKAEWDALPWWRKAWRRLMGRGFR